MITPIIGQYQAISAVDRPAMTIEGKSATRSVSFRDRAPTCRASLADRGTGKLLACQSLENPLDVMKGAAAISDIIFSVRLTIPMKVTLLRMMARNDRAINIMKAAIACVPGNLVARRT